jgi:hypothetical protein
MRFKSFILACVLLSTASCTTLPESRASSRCLNPLCIIVAVLFEQLAECLIKGGCWRSEMLPLSPSRGSRSNPSFDQAPGRATSERKGSRMLVCREILLCPSYQRHERYRDCFWQEECR